MGDVVYAAFELVCNFSLPLSESTAEHLPGVNCRYGRRT